MAIHDYRAGILTGNAKITDRNSKAQEKYGHDYLLEVLANQSMRIAILERLVNRVCGTESLASENKEIEIKTLSSFLETGHALVEENTESIDKSIIRLNRALFGE